MTITKNEKILLIEELSNSFEGVQKLLSEKMQEQQQIEKEFGEIKDKREQYEAVTKGIGDIMVNVHSTCESIITSSESRAKSVVNDANERVNKIGNDVRQKKENFEQNKEKISQMLKTIEENLDAIYYELDKTEEEFNKKESISVKYEEYEKCESGVATEIKRIINFVKQA